MKGLFRKAYWSFFHLWHARINSCDDHSYARRFWNAVDGLSKETVESVEKDWIQEVVEDVCAQMGITSPKAKRRLLKAVFKHWRGFKSPYSTLYSILFNYKELS